MTSSPRTTAGGVILTLVRSPAAVWVAFILVHLWLGLLNLYAPGLPLGDVTLVYRQWVEQGFATDVWVGIDVPWVYPIAALVPMIIAGLVGFDQFGSTWLSMVMVLNAVAFGFITGWGRARERTAVAWWWVGFLLVLGPIAMARIDSVTVPLALVAVTLLATRPRVAAVLLTIATWIKVWPAALVAAALIALRARGRILVAAATASAVVVLVALLLGGGANVMSFITEQTGRGLQVEAPIATPWLWQAAAGVPGTFIYYDTEILTFQIQGSGVEVAAAVMTPVLALVALAVVTLGVRAARAGASAGDLLPPLALALVTVLIAINKVGSPQFVAWLAVPIVLGLATSAAGYGGSFRVPATLAIAIAALTQLIYPYLYLALLYLDPLLLTSLSVRNLLEFVLLGWAVIAVVRSPRAPGADEDPDSQWLPSIWPFHAQDSAETTDAQS